MDFRFTPDELELHRYARTSVRAHLPLSRLSDPVAEAAGWGAFGRDGWLHACLGDEGEPTDLPFLTGLAREAGGVAAGEGFVHNGWLLPRLCSWAEAPERAEWLETARTRPGTLRLAEDAVDQQVRVVRPSLDDYLLAAPSGGLRTLSRRPAGGVGLTTLGGLSAQLGRAPGLSVGPDAEVALRIPELELAQLCAGATVLRAAGLVGLAAEILAVTVTYVGEREQFGQVVGRFQALKHLCADLHAQVEVAWLAVLHAAVACPAPTAVDGASLLATTAALDAARVGAQLHGGMGFTWETDLHWLLKAALDGQVTAGPPASAAHRIGAAVVGRA